MSGLIHSEHVRIFSLDGNDMLTVFVVHESDMRIHDRLAIRVILYRCRSKLQTDFRYLQGTFLKADLTTNVTTS